jgi:hypothetical protein
MIIDNRYKVKRNEVRCDVGGTILKDCGDFPETLRVAMANQGVTLRRIPALLPAKG